LYYAAIRGEYVTVYGVGDCERLLNQCDTRREDSDTDSVEMAASRWASRRQDASTADVHSWAVTPSNTSPWWLAVAAGWPRAAPNLQRRTSSTIIAECGLYPVYTMKLARRAGSTSTRRASSSSARRALDERSTSSFVNVCNITPFKWPDSQLIKPARRALVEPACRSSFIV